MLKLLIACCIALGLLGITMCGYSIYLLRINGKLEDVIKEKDKYIEKQEKNLKEAKESVREKEKNLLLLREQIRVRDREINQLKRKPIPIPPRNQQVI
ncbi:hypothetical protein CVD28_01360 [Bacillus sp. M6-12]|uniref:hypothetical protein n=1 Tax=Bacillus sp. M6-12 TaxID=2054166 RepID=UPI000C757319|nr:hypothetical protein [Bacillus sp. M6-12]PLS19082.1 hypothetical protein CVD28_01360 [Bacillus sp. M6-12]